MTTHALTDSLTMLRRSLRRMRRYPSLTFFVIGLPVVFLLLFVYVFGGTLGAGLGGASALTPPGSGGDTGSFGREAYLAYVLPVILLITVIGAAEGTAISVAMDMTAGITARFRTMSIARSSVLGGHLLGSVIQGLIATAVVAIVAVVIGFRPTTGPLEWAGAIGLLALTGVAVGWLCVALGMVSDSVETASNLPMILVLLPFLSSGFVPAASLPGPLQWFAEHQPFTPIIETLRGLLTGTAIGSSAVLATAWCAAMALTGYLWARARYDRRPAR